MVNGRKKKTVGIKEQDLGISLRNLADELVGKNTLRRKSISDEDIETKVVQSEIALIKSIPVSKWGYIRKLGGYIETITQHMKDHAINIMSSLKRNKELSDKQRQEAIAIIDIIVQNALEFFDQVEKKPKHAVQENGKGSRVIVKVNQKTIVKMVEWDTKAKVLSPKEL